MTNEQPDQIQQQITKAIQARISAPKMEMGDTPEIVMTKLQEARTLLDDVESAMIRVTVLRSNSRADLSMKRLEYEIAFDEALLASRDRHLSDYSTAKEKEAEANTDTIELKSAFRTAELNHQKLEDSWHIVRVCKDSLDRLRQDLLAHYRSFTLEDNLSR